MADWERRRRPLRRRDIEALLAFLPVISAEGFSPGRWHSPSGNSDDDGELAPAYWESAPETRAFMETLYETRWMYPFDWSDGAWQKDMFALRDDPAQMARADLETLRQMLISYARADRFFEGAWAEAFEGGYIRAILERLKEIAEH